MYTYSWLTNTMNYPYAINLLAWILLLRLTFGLEDFLNKYENVGTSNNLIAHQRIQRSDSGSAKYRTKRHSTNDIETSEWTHSEFLDAEENVLLKWQPRHQEILFRVEARTRGYIGIGFSPDGGMEGADIVLGWIDDRTNNVHLLDCHGGLKNEASAPIRDEVEDYRLTVGMQNDTHTVIEFSRDLDTCDSDDYILGSNTVRVIWAIHDKDPQFGAEMVYHGNKRGSQSLHLLRPPPISKPDNSHQIHQWDVTVRNLEVEDDTMYWCKIFKAPTLQQKHHIIGYSPIIGANLSTLVHHALLHECEFTYDIPNIKNWDDYSEAKGHPCYASETPNDWEVQCLTPLVVWAIGSKGEDFPNHIGLPLASRTPSYYMLEIHFDNPAMKKVVVDTAGLRLHYTHKLRQHEGGVMVAGVTISPLHLIPPQQPEYKSAGYCSMDCTKEVFPQDGVNIVSVLLHSHLAGRKLKLRHIRGDKELAPIVQDDRYHFNYQQTRTLPQEVSVLPSDGLITECTYSTINRTKPTFGGYSTREEMCLAFILYYPRTQLGGCYSMPTVTNFFDRLGVQEFYEADISEIEGLLLHGMPTDTPGQLISGTTIFPPFQPGGEDYLEANQETILALQNENEFTKVSTADGLGLLENLIIKEPLEFQNRSFMSHLQSLPYNETLFTKSIEEYFYTGLHLTYCRKRDPMLAVSGKIEMFPKFTEYVNNETQIHCSYKKSAVSSSAFRISCSIFLIILSVL